MARPVSGTISMNGLEEKVTIRALRPEEYPLLADLLYEAIFVPEGAEVPAIPTEASASSSAPMAGGAETASWSSWSFTGD